jgi:hypothetical protein
VSTDFKYVGIVLFSEDDGAVVYRLGKDRDGLSSYASEFVPPQMICKYQLFLKNSNIVLNQSIKIEDRG